MRTVYWKLSTSSFAWHWWFCQLNDCHLVSENLQNPKLNIHAAATQISALIKVIEKKRTEKCFDSYWKSAEEKAALNWSRIHRASSAEGFKKDWRTLVYWSHNNRTVKTESVFALWSHRSVALGVDSQIWARSHATAERYWLPVLSINRQIV